MAAAHGILGQAALQARLDAPESQKAELPASVAKAPPPAPALHRNIGDVYRRKVSALDAALTTGSDTEPDGPPGIEVIGNRAGA